MSVYVFEEVLTPWGQWLYLDGVRVWRPYPSVVGHDFVPYATGGRWVYTDYGWTFDSRWDWGWATFHYGWWVLSPVYGWVWVPGTQWAPAWVIWRHGGGYIGWAPFAPTFAFGHYDPFWMFVDTGYFVHYDVYRYCVPRSRVPRLWAATTPIRPIARGTTRVIGPPPGEIREVVGRIPRAEIIPPPEGVIARPRIVAETPVRSPRVEPAPPIGGSGPVALPARPIPEIDRPEVGAPVRPIPELSRPEIDRPAPAVPAPVRPVPEIDRPEIAAPARPVPELNRPEIRSTRACSAGASPARPTARASAATCARGSCARGSCARGSCARGSCARGTCARGSCARGSCARGTCARGTCTCTCGSAAAARHVRAFDAPDPVASSTRAPACSPGGTQALTPSSAQHAWLMQAGFTSLPALFASGPGPAQGAEPLHQGLQFGGPGLDLLGARIQDRGLVPSSSRRNRRRRRAWKVAWRQLTGRMFA